MSIQTIDIIRLLALFRSRSLSLTSLAHLSSPSRFVSHRKQLRTHWGNSKYAADFPIYLEFSILF